MQRINFGYVHVCIEICSKIDGENVLCMLFSKRCCHVSDGVPRVPADENEARRLTIQGADRARQRGITLFAVGIGKCLFLISLF